ncbi:glycerate kinase [Demequina sp. NBRC 110057]|uniref:glycerate kinase n=1 Tax=Demequina sp. NBRC 110057 TaxID=1570346 RepID=UPI0009FB97C7|nr:glycerate kinase [Demequina sp. NBRC 110057]
MQILVLTEDWPGVPAARAAALARESWARVNPAVEVTALALGGGSARTADAWEGERTAVAGVEVVSVAGATLVAPAEGATRWDPDALGGALRHLAAAHHAGPVLVPVGDDAPAGDATTLWAGDVVAMREAVRGLDIQVLIAADRPLVGFHGMSNAVRDGRESDAALAVAAQAQEERWSAVARATDPAARSSLVGPARLSDAPGTGAAGGLAYCLAAVGAHLTQASARLASLAGADATEADVVVSVGGELTPRTLDHGIVPAASRLAGQRAVPCVVVAPQVHVGRRDLMAAGVVGSHEGEPGEAGLSSQLERVAHTWTPVR